MTRTICAWCHPGAGAGDGMTSHGICPEHAAAMEAEALGLLPLDEVHRQLRELQLDVETLSAAAGCCGVAESLTEKTEEIVGLLGELVRRARAADVERGLEP